MSELVTFGETMLRLSPPRGQRLETEGGFEAQVGGAESNVAAAATSLGSETVWLSKLPANPLGRRVVRALRGHGGHAEGAGGTRRGRRPRGGEKQ